MKGGNSSFWFDNWTKLDVLYFVVDTVVEKEEAAIKYFISDGHWDRDKLMEVIPEELIEYVIDNIQPPDGGEPVDKVGG